MRIVITDSNVYPIDKNPHMLHICSLQRGLREYWVMLCVQGEHKGKCYIEELVPNTSSFKDDIFGNFKFIEDDDLALELAQFAQEHKLIDVAEKAAELADQGKLHWLTDEARRHPTRTPN
jgi:hypothetical protein